MTDEVEEQQKIRKLFRKQPPRRELKVQQQSKSPTSSIIDLDEGCGRCCGSEGGKVEGEGRVC